MKHHPKRTLFHLLDCIDGILYSTQRAISVDWEKMETDTDDGEPVVCRLHVFRDEIEAVDFIEKNKHQIVVCDFFIPPWEDDGVTCTDPRPMIRYAKTSKFHEVIPYIPKNLGEAVDYLIKHNQKDLEALKTANMSQFHFSAGMNMRNSWGLWSGGPLKEWFESIGIFHADDMSGMIMKAFQKRILEEPYDLMEDVKFYQGYWKRKGKV